MNPVEFEGSNVIFAKNQPEYRPLPAHRSSDGVVTCCWSLSFLERLRVLFFGRVWWQTLTFNAPIQPQRPSTKPPELEEEP